MPCWRVLAQDCFDIGAGALTRALRKVGLNHVHDFLKRIGNRDGRLTLEEWAPEEVEHLRMFKMTLQRFGTVHQYWRKLDVGKIQQLPESAFALGCEGFGIDEGQASILFRLMRPHERVSVCKEDLTGSWFADLPIGTEPVSPRKMATPRPKTTAWSPESRELSREVGRDLNPDITPLSMRCAMKQTLKEKLAQAARLKE